MPRRLTPLVNGCFYHIFNHGIDEIDTFTTEYEYKYFQLALWFYQPIVIQFRLSSYFDLGSDQRQSFITECNTKPKKVHVHAFCLMSNHYHLLLEQLADDGISKYMAAIQNSYARFFNHRQQRKGPLFTSSFKVKQINNEYQFTHVSRYIHLNPYTAHLCRTLSQLKNYQFSSLPEYLGKTTDHQITNRERLSHYFPTPESYWSFIADQADYQRQLSHIAHLLD